jgi:hypothetical protein
MFQTGATSNCLGQLLIAAKTPQGPVPGPSRLLLNPLRLNPLRLNRGAVWYVIMVSRERCPQVLPP